MAVLLARSINDVRTFVIHLLRSEIESVTWIRHRLSEQYRVGTLVQRSICESTKRFKCVWSSVNHGGSVGHHRRRLVTSRYIKLKTMVVVNRQETDRYRSFCLKIGHVYA